MLTNDVASQLGVSRSRINLLRHRRKLRLAPAGDGKGGRGNQLDWSPEAVAELSTYLDRSRSWRGPRRYRRA